MQLSKRELLGHLRIINASGLIPTAVLKEDFSVTALNDEEGIMVHTSGLDLDEQLEEEVGILDLSLVIQALNKLYASEVGLSVNNGRLNLTSEEVGFSLLTCDPDYVDTKQEQSNFDKILEYVENNTKCTFRLTHSFVENFTGVYSIIGSEDTFVNVTPEGTQFVVGNHSENEGVVEIEELTHDEPFSVQLSSRVIVSAMKLLVGEEMGFTGDNSIVTVFGGDYQYIISPVAS